MDEMENHGAEYYLQAFVIESGVVTVGGCHDTHEGWG